MFVCTECGDSQAEAGFCSADGAPLAPVGDDPLLGKTVGVFRVARLIGLGGMGRVYKGVHPTIGSRVAIKVLSRESSDRRDLVDRFFAEAKAVNLIRHESIVDVLDLSRLPDGRPYLVMEFLDGSSLAAIIEGARRSGMPLPIGGVARLCVEVLDGLGAAHAKGIVHRDLKPDNIYVSRSGRPKILDFGIAKLQPEHGGSATHSSALLGTPHYMSPEQAAGRPVDLRADLYAIGVILFECMTLRRPFAAEALFELLRMHIEVPPPSPSSFRGDLPEGVEHVIRAALAKQPEQRFASAQAMSMALQNATANLPPQQWAALQPAGTVRAPARGGWSPTPPASWAGAARGSGGGGTTGNVAGGPPRMPASVASDPQATMATHGGAPHGAVHSPMPGTPMPAARPPTQPPPYAPLSPPGAQTPTAGQVARMPAARQEPSRKGLWIGIGVVLLVGGSVTAAIVSGNSTTKRSSNAQAGSASGAAIVTSGSGSSSDPSSDPWSGSAGPTTPGLVPVEAVGEEPREDGSQESAVDPFAMLPSGTKNQLDDMYRKMFEQLPPKMVPPELTAALKKYGSFTKIPAAEQRRLMQLFQLHQRRVTADMYRQAADALSPEPSKQSAGAASQAGPQHPSHATPPADAQTSGR
jgi:tRNA A-37 threonylcarbamoyl transferase component Bud32